VGCRSLVTPFDQPQRDYVEKGSPSQLALSMRCSFPTAAYSQSYRTSGVGLLTYAYFDGYISRLPSCVYCWSAAELLSRGAPSSASPSLRGQGKFKRAQAVFKQYNCHRSFITL